MKSQYHVKVTRKRKFHFTPAKPKMPKEGYRPEKPNKGILSRKGPVFKAEP